MRIGGLAVSRAACGVLGLLIAACSETAAPPSPATSNVDATPIVIGESWTLSSAILSDEREINVWKPADYEQGREIRGVLYVLDGAMDQDFQHIAGLGQLGALSWTYEALLVVGVQTRERRYELTPPPQDERFRKGFPEAGGAPEFRRFLEEELQPFVEARYRTGERKALIGESLAGLFVVDTALNAPSAFDDYIAISPSLWWDGGRMASLAAASLAGERPPGRRLYLAIGDEGGVMQEAMDELVAALEAAPGAFDWRYSDKSESETHATIYHGAALDALRWLYETPWPDVETPWWMTRDGQPPEDTQ